MIVAAFVVIADGPEAVDPLALVRAEPMVVRAVRSLLAADLVDRVEILTPGDRVDAVEQACRGLPVGVRAGHATTSIRTHIGQRARGVTGDGSVTVESATIGSTGIVLLHDAARALAPPGLAAAVVDAVRRGHPAAVPVLPATDTVKQLDATGVVIASPDRSTLRVVQTPMALRAELLRDPPLRTALELIGSGVPVAAVPGHPLAFPIRTTWDLELAELLSGPAGSRP